MTSFSTGRANETRPKHRLYFETLPYRCPLECFKLFQQDKHALLFHSSLPHTQLGRYSFIAIDPFISLQVAHQEIILNEEPYQGKIFELLNDIMDHFQQEHETQLPPFQGGLAGYFSYDFLEYIEDFTSKKPRSPFPDLYLCAYDLIISFDHETQKTFVLSSGFPKTGEAREHYAIERVRSIKNKLETELHSAETQIQSPIQFSSEIHCEPYLEILKKTKQYIFDGDIFQANISQRFQGKLSDNSESFEIYKNLIKKNPAYFSAFLQYEDHQLISLSPERFLSTNHSQVETRPIKGTAPRSNDPIIDKENAERLQNSEKDRAENVMIVDLLRNDLSKVCKQVEVKTLCSLETHPAVHHLVSVVTAILKPNKNIIDLIAACFPGGSITGAPKLRAIEIIDELEASRRGPYCGSIAYLGFNGLSDLSIIIRTLCVYNNTVYLQAGGGITLASDEMSEYQETLDKINKILQQLEYPA